MIKRFKPYFLFIVPGLIVLMLMGSCRSTSYPQKRKKNKKCDCPRWTQNDQPGMIGRVKFPDEAPLSANYANSLVSNIQDKHNPFFEKNLHYAGQVQAYP